MTSQQYAELRAKNINMTRSGEWNHHLNAHLNNYRTLHDIKAFLLSKWDK